MKAIFIVGVGRSGTSLLQSMFAANPHVGYMPETGFLRRYLATSTLERLYQAKGRAAVINLLFRDHAFLRLGLDPVLIVDRAIEIGGSLDKAIYRLMFKAFQGDGVAWVGDKDPRLTEYLPLIRCLFNDAQVVNIVRDPRDILLSKKTAAWSRGGHVWRHIFANRVQLRMARHWGRRLFGNNYHEILYEELIGSPRHVLSRLCQGLGIPFDSAMLSYSHAAKMLVSEEELSWKKETFGSLLSNNYGKWRAELPLKEIALSEWCCREAFFVGRYKPGVEAKTLSWADRVWVLIGYLLICCADPTYRTFRDFRAHHACN